MAAAAGTAGVSAPRAAERAGARGTREQSADARGASGAPVARRRAAARAPTTPVGSGAAGRPAFTAQKSGSATAAPLAEPRAEVGGNYRQERSAADQQPAERSVSWPSQSEQLASRPRALRNEPAPEEHENNSLMREEPRARPWRGAAPLPEAPLLHAAPEPPVDPLPQRRSPSALRRPPLAEPRAKVAGDYRQEDVPPRHTPERSAVDESLAEMAQRLEATLRKPKSTAPTATAPAHPQANQSKAAAPANPAPYDDLEWQMASLLGRSSKKPDDFA